MLKRTVIGLFAATAVLVGGAVVPSAIADNGEQTGRDVHAAAVTITYDDSAAPEYTDAITQAIQIWNDSVNNVEITKAQPGQQAEVSFESFDGWPQAELGPIMPGGHGTIWYGKEAVDEGYNVIRIAAHEFGHSIGLSDLDDSSKLTMHFQGTHGYTGQRTLGRGDILGARALYSG